MQGQPIQPAWDKPRVEAILAGNKKLQMEALLMLYKAQTPEERAMKTAENVNGKGFCKFDAEILTSFAEQLQRKGYLSGKQMIVLRKRLPKYWRQIAKMISPEVENEMNRQEKLDGVFGEWS